MATSIIKARSYAELAKHYVQNNLVTVESFTRMQMYKKGDMLFLKGNLYITPNQQPTPEQVQIGTIDGWNAIDSCFICVPGQSMPSATLLIEIKSNGDIYVYSEQTFGGFFRFIVCIPAEGGA